MCDKQILHNPINQMVLEWLDQLMKDIWCDKLMDICSWEVTGEWLDFDGETQLEQHLVGNILTTISPRIP
jgi:hypothetical protein